MASRALRIVLKTSLWLLGGVVLLVLLACAYTVYVVYSFDTHTPPARQGKVDTRLYSDPGAGPRPLIVGLGGAEGGNSWTHDYWSAQRERFVAQGYGLLALGYFGLPNTPEKLDRIALEGIQHAIAEAQADPRIGDQCTILIGGSKGAELALVLGAHDASVDAVIAMAPADTVFPGHTEAFTTSSWSYRGTQIPFAPIPWSATMDLLGGNIGAVMERVLNQDEAAAAAIAVERINGPILLIAAEHDEMWPALRMSQRIISRLDRAGFAHAHELLQVEGDHRASAQHFDAIADFLARVVSARPGCKPYPAQP